jgi:cell filamentation protein
MRDPYLYEDVPVLKNKLGIKDQAQLDAAEGDYVSLRLKAVAQDKLPGDYHTPHFLQMHEHIFQDLYDWAGCPRTIVIFKEEDVLGGLSVEYSDPFDIVNDIHHVLTDMRNKAWKEMDRRTAALEFCDTLAKLWRIHPFREGNTRTTVTFCCQFIEEQGFEIKRELFENNARYVRTALVAYNAYFADGQDFSKKEYLERIVIDAFSE